MRARRTVYVFFHCLDGPIPDLEAFYRGEARLVPAQQVYAISLLRGEECPISQEELEFALSIRSYDWVEVADEDCESVRELARKGVLLSDEGDDELAELKGRDEQLSAAGWHLYGAFHYLMTKWSAVDLRMSSEEGEFPAITEQMLTEFVAERGRPPDPFYAMDKPLAVRELPVGERDGELHRLLAQRKTTRGFDRSRPMTIDELSTVLYEVWGCHGTAPILEDILFLQKTSPSGGGMHPVEAYPIVSGVEGVESGIHHYNVRDHSLELVERLGEDEAAALVADFTCGQNYFGSAHVSVVMTARFGRNHWKYRRQQKAYPVILMDAAHLSQTLYLVAAEFGLGAYVTMAINSLDIEQRLGLDGVGEGVVAVAGFGHRRPEPSPFEPRFTPYVPRGEAL